MFPENAFSEDQDLEIIKSEELGKVAKFDFPTNSFIMEDGKFVYCTDIEAVEQWIQMLILTKSSFYKCYEGTDFGNYSTKLLFGQNLMGAQEVLPEIETELTQKLLEHKSITQVYDVSVSIDLGVGKVEITVDTVFGEISKVVNI